MSGSCELSDRSNFADPYPQTECKSAFFALPVIKTARYESEDTIA